MSIRDLRQKEFAELFLQNGRGILHLCPRFGKCRVGVEVIKQTRGKILIVYPDKHVKDAWIEEFEALNINTKNINFVTFKSVKHEKLDKYNLIIIDEIHLLSENQRSVFKDKEWNILGLSGTISKSTAFDLKSDLDLNILAEYPLSVAIQEGILCDYEINIITCPLDNSVLTDRKGKMRTELQQYNAYSSVIDRLEKEGKATFFLRLSRMRLIQKSIAKLNLTKRLLKKFEEERTLVFCGLIDIANSLGCPVHHSRKTDDLTDFAKGGGNHLAVVKLGNVGVTYKPLNRVIINYFDSNSENLAQKINRCMAIEYDNPEKKASIWIVSSNEKVELGWLKKALEFFDKKKIKYYETADSGEIVFR